MQQERVFLAVSLFAALLVKPSPVFAEPVQVSALDIGKWQQATPESPAPARGRGPAQPIVQANQAFSGAPLSISGNTFNDGLAVRGGSVLYLNLDGGSDKFSATVGVDDSTSAAAGRRGGTAGRAPPVVFRVLGDGKILYASQPLQRGDPAEAVSIDTKGIKTLVLNAQVQGGGNTVPYADWANAALDVTGAKPEAVAIPADEPVILTPKPGPAPKITGPVVTGVTAGHPVLYKIPATGDKPITYSVDNLPDGLVVDTATGIISGVIKEKGAYEVTFHAKNTLGEDSRKFKFDANGLLELTPALGWNSWNCFGVAVTDARVRQAADAMVEKGLIDHGWTYVNIDDGWERTPGLDNPQPGVVIRNRAIADPAVFGGPTRDANGNILTNTKFPDMKALADYVHGKGLKIGIYSSPGPTTCQGLEATWQHEDLDAMQWANWGFDYIKYDWCSYNNVLTPEERGNITLEVRQRPYTVMRASLNKVPRDLIYSLCQYGAGNVWEWGAEIGGNSWRTTGDIIDTWQSMSNIGFAQVGHSQYAQPGHWNDPDMLVVGKVGWGPNLRDSRLTPSEQYVHITLWTLLASPLLIGCDMTQMDDFTLGLLTNDEVLAVHQDPLGKAADRVAKDGLLEVWSRPQADGSLAVGLFNRDEMPMKVSAKWADLKITGKQAVRDLWRQKDLGEFTDEFTAEIPRHGCLLVKLTPVK